VGFHFPIEVGHRCGKKVETPMEVEAPMEDDSKPNVLNYLFEVVWKIEPAKRDHPCFDPRNWVDEPPKGRMIRTHCKLCGDFVGYRPRPNRNSGGSS
jgi:hypothetical protein